MLCSGRGDTGAEFAVRNLACSAVLLSNTYRRVGLNIYKCLGPAIDWNPGIGRITKYLDNSDIEVPLN